MQRWFLQNNSFVSGDIGTGFGFIGKACMVNISGILNYIFSFDQGAIAYCVAFV